ncbi:helix-turn-helix domain-containing protein [Anaeromicrobium sediminis]|uniref:DNA-binding protein n=1 Tax=Anaeromicrobium sediminis TaxID=1478221 RepID=A0A267MM77_9FIRM|nr:XRE family transcriptional regulator [Anaeromicrobium sediminis]PAB60711.1 DNA-binding protein [Anaeromicrobium sediminis]
MTKDIGKKIKFLRQTNEMTLKDLSEKTGLSSGFLSQLERGLTTIAIDSLDKIASALNIELTYFFSSPKKNSGLIMKSYEQEVSQIMNSKIIYYSLSNNLSESTMVPKLVTVLPNEDSEEIQKYPHEGEEFIYILEGILTLYIDKEKHILHPGDSAHFNSSLDHNWTNHTNKNVKLLVVNTPNFFKSKKSD